MIQISQIKLQIPHTEEKLKEKVLKLLRLREKDLISFRILKKSLDARKKPRQHVNITASMCSMWICAVPQFAHILLFI